MLVVVRQECISKTIDNKDNIDTILYNMRQYREQAVYMCVRIKLNKFLKISKKLLTIQIRDDIIYKLSARTTQNSTDIIKKKKFKNK